MAFNRRKVMTERCPKCGKKVLNDEEDICSECGAALPITEVYREPS